MLRIKTAQETAEVDYNLSKMLETGGGLEKLALEKLPPFIRDCRDYEAFGRKVLLVHNVTGEEMHIINGEAYVYYPKDMNSHATFFADDGQIPRYQIEGDGVNVAITTVASDDITINLKRLMVQKYNYLERVRELSGQAIGRLEDNKIIQLCEYLLKGNGTDLNPEFEDQIAVTSDVMLYKAHLVQLKKRMSKHDVPLAAFVMSPSRLDDILTWAQNEVDPLSQREMLETGVKYSIWGTVKLVTSTIIDENIIYAFSEKEYVGRMPVLKDISVKLTEVTNKLEKGLFLFEFVGFYLASQKAISKLILEYNVGDPKIHIKETPSGEGELAKVGEEAKGFGSLQGK